MKFKVPDKIVLLLNIANYLVLFLFIVSIIVGIFLSQKYYLTSNHSKFIKDEVDSLVSKTSFYDGNGETLINTIYINHNGGFLNNFTSIDGFIYGISQLNYTSFKDKFFDFKDSSFIVEYDNNSIFNLPRYDEGKQYNLSSKEFYFKNNFDLLTDFINSNGNNLVTADTYLVITNNNGYINFLIYDGKKLVYDTIGETNKKYFGENKSIENKLTFVLTNNNKCAESYDSDSNVLMSIDLGCKTYFTGTKIASTYLFFMPGLVKIDFRFDSNFFSGNFQTIFSGMINSELNNAKTSENIIVPYNISEKMLDFSSLTNSGNVYVSFSGNITNNDDYKQYNGDFFDFDNTNNYQNSIDMKILYDFIVDDNEK